MQFILCCMPLNYRDMTILWFIYYTVRMVKNKDNTEDGILIMPCLVLDALITAMVGMC